MIIGVLINRSPPKLAVRLDVQSNPLLPPTPIFSLNRYPAPPVRGINRSPFISCAPRGIIKPRPPPFKQLDRYARTQCGGYGNFSLVNLPHYFITFYRPNFAHNIQKGTGRAGLHNGSYFDICWGNVKTVATRILSRLRT